MKTKLFTQPQRERMRRLLHMQYTVAELATELECSRSTLELALKRGCPSQKVGNKLFIVGDEFATWYNTLPVPEKIPLADDEAYCLHCKAARKIVNGKAEHNSPGVELVRGTCAVCGAKVNRLRKEVEKA